MADDTPPVPAQDAAIDARVAGYSWGDINAHIDEGSQAAQAAGYSQPEIDAHLGRGSAGPALTGLSSATGAALSDGGDKPALDVGSHGFVDPAATPGDKPMTGAVPPELRYQYGNAVLGQNVQSPTDFAQHWQNTLSAGLEGDQVHNQVASELAGKLPSPQEFIDHAIAATHAQGVEPSAPMVGITQDGLVRHYQLTGEPPAQALARAQDNPAFAAALTQPRPLSVADQIDKLLGIGGPVEDTFKQMVKGNAADVGAITKGFTDAFEGLTGTPDQHWWTRVATTALNVVPDFLQGVAQAGATAVGRTLFSDPGDADRTMRDLLALGMAVGGNAPDVGFLTKTPEIGETLQHIKTGVHPEAARIIAEAAPDIIAPIGAKPVEAKPAAEGEAAKPELPRPEQVSGELAGNTVINHFGRTLRDLWTDESGSLNIPGGFRMWRTPDEFAAAVRGTADAETAKALVQKFPGMSYRENQAGWRQLEQYARDLEGYIPEYQKEIEGTRQAGGDWAYRYDYATGEMRPRSVIGTLVDYMDGRSGAGIPGQDFIPGKVAEDHPLFPGITAFRQVLGQMRQEIERRGPASVQHFVENYLPRLYQDPGRYSSQFVGKQGSKANTLHRSIPYQVDAIADGHTPRFMNPVDTTMHYVEAMRAFLDQDNIVSKAKELGTAYTASAPRDAADVELLGRGSNILIPHEMTQVEAAKAIEISDRGASTLPHIPYGDTVRQIQDLSRGFPMQLKTYARPGFAKVYNRYYDRGFARFGPKAETLYSKMLHASNASVAAKLGLSLYHLGDIMAESYTTGLSRVLGNLQYGEVREALNGLVNLPAEPARMWLKGKAGQEVFLRSPTEKEWANMNNGASASYEEKLARLSSQANMRPLGRTSEYLIGNMRTIPQALRRGSYARELREGLQAIDEAPQGVPPLRGVVRTLGRGAEFAAAEAGRVLNTAMSPLFDNLIPRIKYGSWLSEMGDFLHRNPGASEEQALGYGRKLSNAMDDRFGELVQDNLHMNKMLRQTLNVLTVSVGWEYGTLRAFSQGAYNLARGNLNNPQARWLPSFVAVTALGNMLMQYLMSGQFPWQTNTPITDLVAGRTGGKTPEGQPERGLFPGYQKDPLQWGLNLWGTGGDPIKIADAVGRIAAGKLNNFVDLVKGIAESHDWQDYSKRVMDAYTPINASMKRERGTNIPLWAEVSGLLRPAPEALEDPARAARQREIYDAYDEIKDQSIKRSQNRRAETPDKQVEIDTSKRIRELQAIVRGGLRRIPR